MKFAAVAAAALLAAAFGLPGCQQRTAAPQPPNHTAVLGSYGPGANGAQAPLTDARGQAIPRPDVPGAAGVQVVRSGDENALAAWVQDGHVVASTFDRAHGWSAPQPLEQIYGQASEPELASNGQGVAMAVWRHTVGSIQSLRYSRYEAATGWSTPDVVPGALPRPYAQGTRAHDAPQLQMDAQGNVTAQWPSGFHASETQVARYVAGEGWSPAVSERVGAAPGSPPAAATPRTPARPDGRSPVGPV